MTWRRLLAVALVAAVFAVCEHIARWRRSLYPNGPNGRTS